MKNATVNILYKYLCEYAFNFSGNIPKNGIDGSLGNSKFNFFEELSDCSLRDCTISHSHQQRVSPRLLRPLQHLNF